MNRRFLDSITENTGEAVSVMSLRIWSNFWLLRALRVFRRQGFCFQGRLHE